MIFLMVLSMSMVMPGRALLDEKVKKRRKTCGEVPDPYNKKRKPI